LAKFIDLRVFEAGLMGFEDALLKGNFMAPKKSSTSSWYKGLSVLVATATVAASWLFMAAPSDASVTQVTGSAYGYLLKVNLFGGPDNTRGVGQEVCTGTDPNTYQAVPAGCVPPGQADAASSPEVTLPAGGSATAITGTKSGASGFVGPAEIFSSGQLDVSTQGTPATGSVTSSTKIANVDRNGSESFGYGPLDASTLYPKNPSGLITDVTSTCTASETGVSGSTTITNGQLELDNGYDPMNNGTYTGTGSGGPGHPPMRVMVPNNPAPNTIYNGHIEVNGSQDFFKYVFNEQVTNADGSLTVYAGHEYLLGPTAKGDLFFGKSECGVVSSAAATTTTTTASTTTTTATSTTTTTVPGGATGTTTTTTVPGAGSTAPLTAIVTPLAPPAAGSLGSGGGIASAGGPALKVSSNQVAPGDRVNLTGDQFPAGATLKMNFLSTPVALGTVVTNATGSFQTSVAVPGNAVAGDHHINVTDSSGRELASVALSVRSGSPGALQGGLARTGTNLGDLTLLGLATMLFGLFLLAAQRMQGIRRKTRSRALGL